MIRPRSRFFRPNLFALEGREVPAVIGGLDPSFGTAGKFTANVAAGTNQGNAVAIQNDGKIVIAGTTDINSTTNSEFLITRLNPNGTLDPTFGTNGTLTFGVAGKDDVATSIGLQSDGKIIVGGYTNRTGNYDGVVFRLTTTGGLDPSFFPAGSGLRTVDIGATQQKFNALQVQTDDRIVLTGSSGAVLTSVLVTRTTKDGAADTFGTAGNGTFSLGGLTNDIGRSLEVQTDNSVVVVGDTGTAANLFGFFMKVKADGTGTVAGFGPDVAGAITFTKVNFSGIQEQLFDVTSSGTSLIGVGYATPIAGNKDSAIARVDSTTGAIQLPLGTFDLGAGANDELRVVGVQADGRVLVGGTANADFLAARFAPDVSALDTTFGTNGKTITNLGGDDAAFAGTADGTGRFILIGRNVGSVAALRGFFTTQAQQNVALSGTTDGKLTTFVPTFDTTGKYKDTGTSTVGLSGFAAPVRTALADVNGDGVVDTVVVAGPGGLPLLAVKDGVTGNDLFTPFSVFETTFTGGLYVAAGDLDGDGRAEVVVTPDLSGGPVVAVYSGDRLAKGQTGDAAQITRFFGIDGDPTFRGGARPAIGDVNGDGFNDLVVSAGFSGGPRVALFDGKQLGTGKVAKLIGDFFVFESTVSNGAYLSVGDVNGDGMADIVVGGGPNGGPRVRVIDGRTLLASGTFIQSAPVAGSQIADFLTGASTLRGGVTVSVRDVDGDGNADVVTGSGQKEAPKASVFLGKKIVAGIGGTPTADQTLSLPGAPATLDGGVFVG